MRLDDQVRVIEDSKAIDNVGANSGVNVRGFVFSSSWSIPSPIGEIANNLWKL